MLFSSTVFVFGFLPLVLSATLLMARLGLGIPARNALLLVASLFFYAWGETGYVAILLVSIVANHVFGLWIDGAGTGTARRRALGVAVATNLAGLCIFKYANFLVDGWNAAFSLLGLPAIVLAPIHLPIGISFFTFQAITYVVDVYRRDAPVDSNPFRVALYISLFPQLIAGPIVRYHWIASELRRRSAAAKDDRRGAAFRPSRSPARVQRDAPEGCGGGDRVRDPCRASRPSRPQPRGRFVGRRRSRWQPRAPSRRRRRDEGIPTSVA